MKQVKDKNFKSLRKTTKEDIRRWQYLSCPCICCITVEKMAILLKVIYRFYAIPIKIPTQFFIDLGRTILKILMGKQPQPQPQQQQQQHTYTHTQRIAKTILNNKITSGSL